jgi:hypothetical protein
VHVIDKREPAAEPVSRRAAVADLRVEVALRAIEDAQQLADLASEALSAVAGMAPEHDRLGKLHGQVRRCWYAVRRRSERLQRQGQLLLDHDPGEAEISRWASVRERR